MTVVGRRWLTLVVAGSNTVVRDHFQIESGVQPYLLHHSQHLAVRG